MLDYKGEQGYIIFQHPDLILEFLVPARGKENSNAVPISQLGINAQALRFMDMLNRDPIQMYFADIKVTIPHPADFSLHKLLIAKRRKEEAKAEKDRQQAIALLIALNKYDTSGSVNIAYTAMPKTWQKVIKQELIILGEEKLVPVLIR